MRPSAADVRGHHRFVSVPDRKVERTSPIASRSEEVVGHPIFVIARVQHGAFSLAQAIDVGLSSNWLTRKCRQGAVERCARGVYAVVGAPVTTLRSTMIHLLAAGPGALATADTALALWCPEVDLPDRPVIAVPPSCGYRSPDADLRRSSDLAIAKPTVIDGIPVVGVARALLDASRGRSVDEVVGLIDACRRHLPLSAGALVEALHWHARRGRPGIATFREAVRRLGRQVPDSEFERLVVRDLERAGVPRPRLHHVVRVPDEDPIELDIDWEGVLVDVELDGADHVVRMRKARRDRRRDRVLQAIGYEVLRYTWDDYVEDRAGMIAEIIRFLLAGGLDFS